MVLYGYVLIQYHMVLYYRYSTIIKYINLDLFGINGPPHHDLRSSCPQNRQVLGCHQKATCSGNLSRQHTLGGTLFHLVRFTMDSSTFHLDFLICTL